MEIWRMHPDGSNKEQLTDDEYSNWFAHPSPDGKHLVFISYLQDQGSAHPAMKEVVIRLYTIENHQIRILCGFTGGQGSLNVPSWSPDSKEFAFVSYRKQ
jgi:Tol biopolymer transport system component